MTRSDPALEPDVDGAPATVDQAAALLAEHSGVPLADAASALRADAAALGLPVSEVARDVVDLARAARGATPATLAGLLDSVGPPLAVDPGRDGPAQP